MNYLPTSPDLHGEEKASLFYIVPGQHSQVGGLGRTGLIDMFCSIGTGFIETEICCQDLKAEQFFEKSKFLASFEHFMDLADVDYGFYVVGTEF